MSWDSYIDSLIAHSRVGDTANIDKACIVGENAAWTSGTHPNAFNGSAAEIQKIFAEMKKDDKSGFGVTGITFGGVKYQFLRYDEDAVYGKKKNEGAITIQKCKQCCIVAHCPEGGQHGSCNLAVGKVADYLSSVGY